MNLNLIGQKSFRGLKSGHGTLSFRAEMTGIGRIPVISDRNPLLSCTQRTRHSVISDPESTFVLYSEDTAL
ncbi:hypothetical protein QUF72_11390, partial [Desulfobacterales bacterium HSG2]|nr:hypothetical protein [Desulfobacterales bacterium HSG2]